MSEQENIPRGDERSESDDTIEDLEVPKEQAGDVAGGAGSSGGDVVPIESISLNAKK